MYECGGKCTIWRLASVPGMRRQRSSRFDGAERDVKRLWARLGATEPLEELMASETNGL